MRVFSFSDNDNTRRVVCLGRFDGLHKGHSALIERAKSFCGLELSLFTIKPVGADRNILSFSELKDRAEALGVRSLIVAAGDKDFFSTPSEVFLKELFSRFSVSAVVCGEDYTYGAKKSGNTGTLKDFCERSGVRLAVEKTVLQGGEKVSSTCVRSFLKKGNVKGANELLGYPFYISGEVIRGRGEGRALGFKTANILYPDYKTELKEGVYATTTEIFGKAYNSVTNVGTAPTFSSFVPLVETHVLGFDGDIYGKNIKVTFNDRIRDTVKFDTTDALKKQINKDKSYYD